MSKLIQEQDRENQDGTKNENFANNKIYLYLIKHTIKYE